MYNYILFDLPISSEIELSRFPSVKSLNTTVSIKYGAIHHAIGHKLTHAYVNIISEMEVFLHWPDVGGFLIKDGNQVIVEPDDRAKTELTASFILGPVLAALLHQRQNLVLHAGSIRVKDKAVGFIGESGWGKSTLIATLGKTGYPVMTDDQIVFKNTDHALPEIYAGYPFIKLWPDAIINIGDIPANYPPIYPDVDKRLYTGNVEFCNKPLPLKNIYVLSFGDEVKISKLPGQQAFQQIIRHTFAMRVFENQFTFNRHHFYQSAQILNKINVYNLSRPRSFDSWQQVKEVLEKHFEETL